jgi:hypothetical protein
MATTRHSLPGLESRPDPGDDGRTPARAWIDGYLARYRGRPDTDVPYRTEPARAAYMAGWRACARLLQSGSATRIAAGGTGEKES